MRKAISSLKVSIDPKETLWARVAPWVFGILYASGFISEKEALQKSVVAAMRGQYILVNLGAGKVKRSRLFTDKEIEQHIQFAPEDKGLVI